jgi:hypothetical protein
MAMLIFPGGYRDQAGHEAISWRVEGSRRYGLPRMEIFTTTRGPTCGGSTSTAWNRWIHRLVRSTCR